jgi:HKD family nuclease
MTKFAFNACVFSFTQIFSFLANYEFESRMSFDSNADITEDKKIARKRLLKNVVTNIENKMRII